MTNNLVPENESSANGRHSSEKFITPVSSITESPEGYTLALEMPGVNKDSLEISVENNELSILGRKNRHTPEGTILHRESQTYNFRRSFEIDPSIDSGKIAARVAQGLVTLSLPKAETVKPRKIAIS